MFRLKVGSRSTTTTTADSASASATAALRSLARLSARTARRNPVSALLVALFVVYLLSARAGFPDPDPDRDVDHDDYELGRHPNPNPNPNPHPNLDRVQRREDSAALHAEKLHGRRGRDEAPPVVEDGRVAGAAPQPVPVPAPPAKDAVRVVDESWLAGMLVRVGLGPPADEVPPELKEVVADMLDLYSPRRYEKYAWDL